MKGFEAIDKARKILGLPDMVTEEEIRGAYRALSRRYHPDRLRGEEKRGSVAKFRRITWARDILIKYVDSYRYIFSEKEYKKHLGPEETDHFDHFYSIYGEFLSGPAKKAVEDVHDDL